MGYFSCFIHGCIMYNIKGIVKCEACDEENDNTG